jgi:hypothetical protein
MKAVFRRVSSLRPCAALLESRYVGLHLYSELTQLAPPRHWTDLSRLKYTCDCPSHRVPPSAFTHLRSSPYLDRPQTRTRPYVRIADDCVFPQFQQVEKEVEGAMAGLSSASSGTKRKRAGPSFYAVKVGFTPGIYQSKGIQYLFRPLYLN